MTVHFIGCRMTPGDFGTCQAMLAALQGSGSPLVAALQEKLEKATVVPAQDIDPLTATLFSRVEFQVDDAPPQQRILVRNTFQNGLVGLTLPISTLRGLALLGRRQGQAVAIEESGRRRTLFIRRVCYQPEAARAGPHPLHLLRQQPATVIDFQHARAARSRGGPAAGRSLSSERKGTKI